MKSAFQLTRHCSGTNPHRWIGLWLFTLLFASCAGEDKGNYGQGLEVVPNSAKVEWTAYKTTDKIPVKGYFPYIALRGLRDGNTPEEVLAKAEFIISTESLSTGDPSRDAKIINSFFGLMKDSGSLTGRFIPAKDKPRLRVKMNGFSVDVPAETNFENDLFRLTVRIRLSDFGALEMLAELNRTCLELHKGADGISKTWEEVDVTGTVLFRNKAQ